MSKAEIPAELPKLSAEERGDILARLWQLEETAGPSITEQVLLNKAQASYDANPVQVRHGLKFKPASIAANEVAAACPSRGGA